MKDTKNMKFATKAIHAGQEPDPIFGAIMTPVYFTSTYEHGNKKEYAYGRGKNPTRAALQECIASLEGAKHGLCFSSGMGASDAIIKLLRPKQEVIAANDLYGGSYRMFKKVFSKYGIEFQFVNMHDVSNITEKINKNTKMLWVETPTNPMMQIINLKACADIAKENNLLLVVDNTFATPYLQNPLKYGADIVVHSVTKYLGGHSDVVMGATCTNDDSIQEELAFYHNSCGAVPGPMDSFLVLRGLKTLHLRMERHCSNGENIAYFLKEHSELPGSKIEKVYWPGFPDHHNHEIAKEQMQNGFGGMISFTVKGDKEEALKVAKNCKVITLAESLGGVESLIGHPASMTHASIPKEERERSGVTDSLLRLSVGIEDIDDLIDDLKQAIG